MAESPGRVRGLIRLNLSYFTMRTMFWSLLKPHSHHFRHDYNLSKHIPVALATFTVDVLDGNEIDSLIDRSSSLTKLIRCIVYVLRYWGRNARPRGKAKVVNTNKDDRVEPSPSELNDAWNILVWLDQKKLDLSKHKGLGYVTKKVMIESLAMEVTHYILAGRIKNFPESFQGEKFLPIITHSRFGFLIVSHYHHKFFHRDIDTTVLFTRNNAWVIGARRFATDIDKK